MFGLASVIQLFRCAKSVQRQNQPLKTGIGFLCKAGKMGWFGSKMASAISPV
jgi:hypothetical protein